jgi:purine-nucleoside phosphorylase
MAVPSRFSRWTDDVRAARPQVAVILGSGMGGVARRLRRRRSLRFAEVPGFSDTTIQGHTGQLTFGEWAGKCVLVFEGRLHHYEGHPWRRVTLPIQTAAFLGARVLLLTNAAGGIHDALSPGSLMAVRDHIDWTRPYCWRHPGPGGLGPARPSPYSPRLLTVLTDAARGIGIESHAGVYAAVTGPCYETPAEIRALKVCGADAVGMSTAREVQAGFEHGMECAAVSCITNRAAGLSDGRINHGEVLETAARRCDPMGNLIEGFLRTLQIETTAPR